MPEPQVIVSFDEDGVALVRVGETEIRFDNVNEALGFACEISQGEERDQPRVLLPSNALLLLVLNFSHPAQNTEEWDNGVEKARQIRVAVA